MMEKMKKICEKEVLYLGVFISAVRFDVEVYGTHLVKHCPMSTSSRCPTEVGPEVMDVSLE